MKKYNIYIFILGVFIFSIDIKAQEHFFEKAYDDINEMLKKSDKYSFKKAVFAVENAYEEGLLDAITLKQHIDSLAQISKALIQSRKLKNYNYRDKKKVEKYASLFTIMTDTIIFRTVKNEELTYIPYRYDFEDVWGHTSWQNMFVSKLLFTNKGNCHSLPYLYKIIAEEIGVEAHLALSPNHVYIKHRNLKDGWYNTELTSGIFPNDGWIMASGYIHLDAIRNGMFMKALNQKESLALVMVDLAQGYQRKFPMNDGSFILKCCETALEHYPTMANALLLKLETCKKKIEAIAEVEEKTFNEVLSKPGAKKLWVSINEQVRHIADLGYRQMPKEMYLDWLISLKEEKEKYTNNKISTFKKK